MIFFLCVVSLPILFATIFSLGVGVTTLGEFLVAMPVAAVVTAILLFGLIYMATPPFNSEDYKILEKR